MKQIMKISEKDKKETICSAVESGWSVKKISEQDYKFTMPLGARPTNVGPKRTKSTPVTRKEYFKKILKETFSKT